MAVYGFKDNKCKSQIATIYGDVTDEFGTSATVTTPTGIANVGNNMESNSIAFYHVNNAGFPGSGEGTITAFKTKGGTYKNYMFFDNVNDDFYFLAADGTSKTWKKSLRIKNTYTGSFSLEAGEEFDQTIFTVSDSDEALSTIVIPNVLAYNDVQDGADCSITHGWYNYDYKIVGKNNSSYGAAVHYTLAVLG